MKKETKLLLLPVIIALGYIPLLMHMHVYNTGLSKNNWYPDESEIATDFFLWYKMVAIILVAIVMVIALLYSYVNDKKNIRWKWEWYLLAGYAVLVFMSALLSPYRELVFKGSYEMFESVWVLLSYIVMCFYSYQMLTTEKDMIYAAKYASVGMMVVTMIGFLQFTGFDIFRTMIGKKLITNRSVWPYLDTLEFAFSRGTSYTTLYNTNYLAFYYGMLLPVLVVLLIFTKEMKLKMIYAVMTVLSLFTLIGSNSKSAILALGFTFILGCIVLYKYVQKYIWIPLIICVAMVALFCMYAARMGGFENLFNAIFTGVQIDTDSYLIKDIDTLEDEVVIYMENEELHLTYEEVNSGQVSIHVKDKAGLDISYRTEDKAFVLEDIRYQDCTIIPIYIEDMIALQVVLDEKNWYFVKLDQGGYYFANAVGKFDKMPDVEKSSLFSDGAYSGRGYLWNYTIPLLKSKIILGSGSNSFIMEYPQNNYILKKYLSADSLIDVKPHNFYLQQMLENGILALLLLLFYAIYFTRSYKLYSKIEEYNFSSMLGLGIMLGTFDYMIIAIANDSNVCTAPVFWVLLGAGMAMNELAAKETQNKKTA